MNIVFAGTPEFAVPSLRALVDAGHAIKMVYTQPDRPAGRGRRMHAGPVKLAAQQLGLPVRQPARLKEEADTLRGLRPNVMVVVAYGQILPETILAIPEYGCLNVHASLLPRWRGAAPVARAIEAGDTRTGVTIMQMDTGLDTGDILLTAQTPITQQDTTATLRDRLAQQGAATLVVALERLERGEIVPQPQDSAHASYAPKLRKEEAVLDWRQKALHLQRKVRAYQPWPVASTRWRDHQLRLWETSLQDSPETHAPGTVIQANESGLYVATGDGLLVIHRLQLGGGKVMDVRAFLNGHHIVAGDRLG